MGWGDKLCPMIAEISNFCHCAVFSGIFRYLITTKYVIWTRHTVTEISVDSISEKWYYRFTISLRVVAEE